MVVQGRRVSGRRRPIAPLQGAGGKEVLVEPEIDPELDVIESKLRVPEVRPDSISRTALVNRLRAVGRCPLLVVAPAGYGKTTLLAQWAVKDARPFVWLSADERDNDPVVLLRHLAAALDRIDPIEPRVIEALAASNPKVWDSIVPRLTAQLASRESPLVVVIDDVDLLHSKEANAVVAALMENIPHGSIVALSGRRQPKLPVASLRVGGPLMELGAYELALSRREAEMLLKAGGVHLEEDAIVDLLQWTEGWAAGIYLAALAARDQAYADDPQRQNSGLPGDDRYLTDYIDAEYLSHLSPELLAFLRRTSVLESLCAPVCDAVLQSKNSASILTEFERSNLFLLPLDRHSEWYRYHRLFRDVLQRQLAKEEPDLVSDLNLRAARWCEAQGDPESALGYAQAAGDRDGAARILSAIALQVHQSGRAAMLETWLRPFDDNEWLEQYPAVAVNGSRIHAVRGRPDEAERWLRAAERGVAARKKGVASVRPSVAVMRSAMCAKGPSQMRADAVAARSRLARGAIWRPSALLVEGAAAILLGNADDADSILAQAALEAERLGSTETRVVALSERSILAAACGDHGAAETLALEACDLMEDTELKSYSTSALALAASARAMLRHGMWEKARHQLTLAEKLLPTLTHALPWLAVQARVELGYACVTLRDREGAQRLLEEAREVLAVKPRLGVLVAAVDALADEITEVPESGTGGSAGLTAAELRLLPLLSTHYSFREIGERLFVSRNTIKTQAISVYRKLGISSRSEAIERAAELGLIGPDEQPVGGLRLVEGSEAAASSAASPS